eukprot:CAMPEP_0201591550 /NCGR_PEP_ID=MMETSP0190_2-20130828/189699_1 /ASSEMBLY_ACC=CAM_ASM_000263 /TAXON_ID=37353 /ORGANISM="Rosalina sp." /LENGTH=465 /DNA_ID=CAMNT_0048049941 /DNA_START=2435 /DNA_END=3829 /DNA_ORIENTATION=-
MKNKANLVQTIDDNSFLNIAKEENTINNLTIGQEDTPATKPRRSNNKKQNKKKNKRKKKQQQKQQNQQRVNNNNNNNNNHQQKQKQKQKQQVQQEKGRTQASGVCLDLTDMKNKANLVQTIDDNSFLNIAKEENTINNLTIGQEDTPATKPRRSNNKKQNKKKNKRKKKQQQKQQNQQRVNNNNNNNNNHQQKQKQKQKQQVQHHQQQQQQQPQRQQKQQNRNNSPSQSPVESQYPSIPSMNHSHSNSHSPMSSANSSPAMHNMSPPMPSQVYVPSKVPQQNTQYQQRCTTQVPTQQPMISSASSLSYGLNAIPQSVPQLLTTSSIGSVSSQMTAPMASMPSMISASSVPTANMSVPFGMNSVPNTPTSHPVSAMSTIPSVPNMNLNMNTISTPNMNMINMNQQLQQFRQSQAYFAAFLPSRPAASVPQSQQMAMTMPPQSQPNMGLNTGYMNTSVPVSTNVANW